MTNRHNDQSKLGINKLSLGQKQQCHIYGKVLELNQCGQRFAATDRSLSELLYNYLKFSKDRGNKTE